MPDKVNFLGHQVSKPALIVGVLAGVGAAGYAWWKHHEATTAAATATTTTGASGYGYGGYGYGSNVGYGGGEYYGYGFGYGMATGAYPSEYEYGYGEYGYGYYDPETGQYLGSAPGVNVGSPTTTSTTGVTTPSTNGEWVSDATSQLTNQGYSLATVAPALTKYIAGSELTAAQVTVVQEAMALEGDPPQEGANGYPPAYHQSSTNTNTQGATVTVPNVVGRSQATATAVLKTVGGFKVSVKKTASKTSATKVTAQSPKGGTKAKRGATVTITVGE